MKEPYTFARGRDEKRSRRSILILLIACLVGSITIHKYWCQYGSLTNLGSRSSASRWVHYASNPVLPDRDHQDYLGTVFDISVIREQGLWKMYSSWRRNGSISYSTSYDGFTWDQNLQYSLGGLWDSTWEVIVNRPYVMKRATGDYLMWYTGQIDGKNMGGKLGFAKSWDGVEFFRTPHNPVITADLPWERHDAVMTPSVVELPNGVLRMYYSGGEWYEPDAIGAAHSYDGGTTWVKQGDPIFFPDPTSKHDNHKVTSPHVLYHDGWYYLFYCGFRDVDHATVNLARSRDGLTKWEASVENPIVEPERKKGSWNCDAVYKPVVQYDEENSQWLMWYNGRCGHLEMIGMSSLKGNFGKFVKRAPHADALWY